MKIYTYYDEDDHPILEAPTPTELARKIGVTAQAVWDGLRRKSPRYSVEEVEDEDGI